MLRWDLSVERVYMYNVNTSFESNLLMKNNTNTTAIEIADIPYNQQIRVSITSVNCYSESSKAKFNFIISETFNFLMYNYHNNNIIITFSYRQLQ